MLYRIGTQAEWMALEGAFHHSIMEELKAYVDVLDLEYGADRDYMEVGGYALLAETKKDLEQVKAVLNYDSHPCEWAMRLWGGIGYVAALYLLNNEFTIQLYMPEAIAPVDVLEELTD